MYAVLPDRLIQGFLQLVPAGFPTTSSNLHTDSYAVYNYVRLICRKFFVQPLNFVSEVISVFNSSGKGRGVFANAELKKNTVIEIAPVIVMNRKDRLILDQSLLH